LLLFGDSSASWHLWWQPLVVAALYVLGQVFTLTSLAQGEISVAAPVLGLKIVFVPIFLWMVGAELLPTSIWVACVGATLAVILLNATNGSSSRGKVLYSVVCATLGAAAFAMFDVCVQLWSSNWGARRFLPIMFIASTAISLAFIPFFRERLSQIPRAAWPSLLGGAIFFAAQALGIVCSVAFWEQVAIANVVYSSRGLWSLAFIWLLGRWLRIADTGLDARVFILRTCGALLLLASIAILVL
jgi:drug/metabolite transporter (DMT)-like permease